MKTQVMTNIKEISLSNMLKDTGRLIIAGPCAAETPEQLLKTAISLVGDGRINFLRAGIWKPRTSPGSFEGVGVEGLQWLSSVKAITGLPVATEVGSERHVYEALKHGVDLLWIGARTVSNPFAVQEIAEAIRGVDIPVLVKNPLSPDLDLWEGAIKRFARTGIKQVGAIHRGFSTTGKSSFRNHPDWAIPLALKQRMPELIVISDPSHIAGNRDLVPLVAQRAMASGFDGLMVEVHPDPMNALSDAAQQLEPHRFISLLNRLFDDNDKQKSDELLTELRMEIDALDDELVSTLSKRMELVDFIANVKKTSGMEVVQPKRWERVVSRVTAMANERGLRPSFIKKLFASIHRESCDFQQMRVMDKLGNQKKALTLSA